MPQRELTEQEVARFSKDGVIKVDQAVESDWIPKLLAVAEQQLKKPSKWVNDVNSGASEDRLFTDRYLWRNNDVIHQFIRESGCARLAAQAMNSQSSRFYFDHLLIKKVKTKAPTPWHQDAAVLNTKGQKLTDMVTVWIPFTKTTKKNGCMITVKKINKIGLLNHVSGYRGQVELKNSELLDNMKHIYLEANIGDVILLHKHSIHCSLPNRSNDFRISADLRYNVAGQPSGREPLPNFYVRSKNKKNLKIKNFKQWLALWEKAKEKCIPRKFAFKYPLPTFKNNKRDLSNLI